MGIRDTVLPLVLLGTLCGAPAAPAFAQSATGYTCAQIEDEARRLLCYDLVFRAGAGGEQPGSPSAQSLAGAATNPNWPLRTETSRLGQGMALTITRTSTEPISGDDQMGEVSINCDDNRTSMSFVLPGYFMASGDGGNVVRARVDLQAFESYETIASESIMILFGGTRSLPLIRKMLEGSQLTVEATSSSGEEVTVTYDLDGLTEAIQPIRQSCNW